VHRSIVIETIIGSCRAFIDNDRLMSEISLTGSDSRSRASMAASSSMINAACPFYMDVISDLSTIASFGSTRTTTVESIVAHSRCHSRSVNESRLDRRVPFSPSEGFFTFPEKSSPRKVILCGEETPSSQRTDPVSLLLVF